MTTPDDFYKPNRPPMPSWQPQHGVHLFEFLQGHDRKPCELRDYGEIFGVEAQFWRNEEFVSRGILPATIPILFHPHDERGRETREDRYEAA